MAVHSKKDSLHNPAATANPNRDVLDYNFTIAAMARLLFEHEAFDREASTLVPAFSKLRVIERLMVDEFGFSNVTAYGLAANHATGFLSETREFAQIITTPPFNCAIDFIAKAKLVARTKFAMLLPINFLTDGEFHREVRDKTDFPLARIYPMLRDVKFGVSDSKAETSVTSQSQVAWFVWERGHIGGVSTQWINGDQRDAQKEHCFRSATANDNSEPAPKPTTHEFFNGDCLEVMRQMPSESIDLIITSPPFNLGKSAPNWRRNDNPKTAGYDGYNDERIRDEYVDWQRDCLREMWRLLKPSGAIFYNHKPRISDRVLDTRLNLIPSEIPIHQIVIWNTMGRFHPNIRHYAQAHQWIIILSKPDWQLRAQGASGVGDVWDISGERNSDHPYPFPVAIPSRIIETSHCADVVFDPFAGSGTTALAALRLGKSSISIEQSAQYVEMSRRRIGGECEWAEDTQHAVPHFSMDVCQPVFRGKSSELAIKNGVRHFANLKRKAARGSLEKARLRVLKGIDNALMQAGCGQREPFRGWYNVIDNTALARVRWGKRDMPNDDGESATAIKRTELTEFYLRIRAEVEAGEFDERIEAARRSIKKRRPLSASARQTMTAKRMSTIQRRMVETENTVPDSECV